MGTGQLVKLLLLRDLLFPSTYLLAQTTRMQPVDFVYIISIWTRNNSASEGFSNNPQPEQDCITDLQLWNI